VVVCFLVEASHQTLDVVRVGKETKNLVERIKISKSRVYMENTRKARE
jgi:hypothetical protein